MAIDLSRLSSPFKPEQVEWRVGATTKDKSKGLALCYIDARDVMGRLDEVCGAANWQCEYPHAGSKTICRIGILINNDWVWKANGCGDTATEAEKGACSDAFKRAAVLWGIGRYLYDVKSIWVGLKPQGRPYVIDPKEMTRLHKILPASNTVYQEIDHDQEAHEETRTRLIRLIDDADSLEKLDAALASKEFMEGVASLPDEMKKHLRPYVKDIKEEFRAKQSEAA